MGEDQKALRRDEERSRKKRVQSWNGDMGIWNDKIVEEVVGYVVWVFF